MFPRKAAAKVRKGCQCCKGLQSRANRPGVPMKQWEVPVMLAFAFLAPRSAEAQRGGFGGGGMGGMGGMGGNMPRFDPPALPGPEPDASPGTAASTKLLLPT